MDRRVQSGVVGSAFRYHHPHNLRLDANGARNPLPLPQHELCFVARRSRRQSHQERKKLALAVGVDEQDGVGGPRVFWHGELDSIMEPKGYHRKKLIRDHPVSDFLLAL